MTSIATTNPIVDPATVLARAVASSDGADVHALKPPAGVTISRSAEEDGLKATIAHIDAEAEQQRQRWAARVERDGTPCWVSPFDTARHPEQFDSIEACVAHMKEHCSAQIAQAILEQQPREAYSPKKVMIPPPRRLSDWVLPSVADAMQVAEQRGEQPLRVVESHTDSTSNPVTTILSLPSADATPRLASLDDDQLVEVARRTYFDGRQALARAARKLMDTRGLTATW